MSTFSEKLKSPIQRTGGCLCVGLDVDLDKMPKDLPQDGQGGPALLPVHHRGHPGPGRGLQTQPGFFRVPRGTRVSRCWNCSANPFPMTSSSWLDAKRGDIGNTSQAYAKAFYGLLKSDALTLSPYMGKDSIEPFLEYPGTCSFVLCLTSNPSSADFQLQTLQSGRKTL